MLLALLALGFQDPGGRWDQLDRMDGLHGESFGDAMAIGPDYDGDGWPEFLVGAPDRHFGNVGGASLMRGGADQPIWEFVSPYWLSNASCTGAEVAFVPDLNFDGYADVLVGDPCDRELATGGSGRVYVLDGLRGTILREHTGLRVGTGPLGDNTGAAVLGVADVDQDGAGDYVVGAPSSDFGFGTTDYRGKVTLFSGSTGVELWSFGGQPSDGAGRHLAVGPDLTLDGRPEILTNGHFPYAAYYLDPMSGHVVQTIPQMLNSVGTSAGGAWSLAAADLDGDGLVDLLRGSHGSVPGVPNSGLLAAVSSATKQILWRTESNVPYELFGYSMSPMDDLDLDGIPEILVGVPTDGVSHASGEGYAQVLSGRDGSHLWSIRTSHEQRTGYGRAVGTTGRHGRRDVALIGEPFSSLVLPSAGAVHVVRFEPFLTASEFAVSAAAGASITYSLDFPASEAGLPYALLASASGRGPTMLGGLAVPLTADSVFTRSVAGNYPAGILFPRGRLDANGRAQSFLNAAPGALAAQVGRTFHLAAVIGMGGAARLTSIAVPLVVEP